MSTSRPTLDLDAQSEARRLRDVHGYTYEMIGHVLGVSVNRVASWLNPEAARTTRLAHERWRKANPDKLRAAEAKRRGTCETCGGPMGVNVSSDGECAGCRSSRAAERAELVERLWRDGKQTSAIADELDTSAAAVTQILVKLRRDGRIGYRLRRRTQTA